MMRPRLGTVFSVSKVLANPAIHLVVHGVDIRA